MLQMSTLPDLGVTTEDCEYPVQVSRQQAPGQQGPHPHPESSDNLDLSRGTPKSSDTQVCIDYIFITEQCLKAWLLDLRIRK